MVPNRKLTQAQYEKIAGLAGQLHADLAQCESTDEVQAALQKTYRAFVPFARRNGLDDDVLGDDPVHNAKVIARRLGWAGLRGDELKRVMRETAAAMQNLVLPAVLYGTICAGCCQVAFSEKYEGIELVVDICEKRLAG